MYKALMLAGAAAISFALLSADVHAQGTPQTVELVKVDVQTLGGGYRASKVIGSSVLNDAQETIGQIEEILLGDFVPLHGLGDQRHDVLRFIPIFRQRQFDPRGVKVVEAIA